MESKSIKYKGISRIPSDNDSFDGELEEMYNLVNFNGELKPIVPPDTVGTVSGELIFVHKNSGYEHFISLDGSVIKAYNYKDGAITEIGNITNIYGETFRKTESVGNTIIILTDKEVKYCLWINDAYKYLGNKIPFPVISFSGGRDRHAFDVYGIGAKFEGIIHDPTELASDSFYKSELGMQFMNVFWGYANKCHAESKEAGYLSFPVYVRYAVRLYDGSLINHSMPFLMISHRLIEGEYTNSLCDFKIAIPTFPLYNMKLSMDRYKLVALWESQDLSNWADIITSIDIFVSPEIWTYPEGAKLQGRLERPDVQQATDCVIRPFLYENLRDRIINVENFYLAVSLSLDRFKADRETVIGAEIVRNITANEIMKDDYLSQDTITAENSFNYNNKLHLSGIQRKRFPGFKLSVRTVESEIYFDETVGPATIDIGFQPFIFYPGKCAKMYVYVENDRLYSYFDEISLAPHPTLNGSYYMSQNYGYISTDKNIEWGVGVEKFNETVSTGIKKSIVFERDKIYVSEHQNPFLFPVNSRITLPVSRIIAISSNTEAISQGQFGQFPLFAFTDDGIWALEVNQEGKYMARQPVSREIAINRNILQMDKSLAFITAKGITILNGSQTECISDIIKDNNTRASKLNISSFINAVIPENERVEIQGVYQTVDIELFLKDASLAYEYINGHGRIYAINGQYKYAYVFDILSKTWGKVKSDYKRAVNNYPDTYVQSSDGTIKILSSLGQSQSNIQTMFITRPIKLENVLFYLQWLNHKGILNNTLNTVVYGSRDGINYQPIKSGTKRLLRLTGSPYRFFKIGVIASLAPKDILSGIDISFEPRYTNRLR